MSDKPKRVLSPEHLEKLKLARVKALEAKHKIGTIKKAEKESKRKAIEDKYQEVMAKKQPAKPVEVVPQHEELVELPKEVVQPIKKSTKKKIKKIIEVSSSDDDEEEDAEESEPEVEYVVRKSKKSSKAKAPPKEYQTRELTTTVARDMLRQRVLDQTQSDCFKSLFPYHHF
jgi:hypothetical protein